MVEADRNLLFGILALQVDFVGRDELLTAMQAWVLEKHKALGQILVERGALSAKFRELLEPMVDAHIERHGGDPARSLAALSTANSAGSPMHLIDDPDVQASLARVATEPTSKADSIATRYPEAGASTAPGLRFRVLRPHARGGIGAVFVAHDRELNREVALKEIQEKHADDPSSRSRFLLEAEVTGGLEHPGIVPVYGLGHHADGRPYYAMRFIRGDSLKEAIGRFHGGEVQDPAARALSLRSLLRRFLDVCDAMAYAHSRGVLHRDLKPGNIMLGKYGETLIVDWGLAKARGMRDPIGDHGESPFAPSSASGSAETLPGSAIGTPAYMSPEQASGELDRLGPASDVYSLGATLYSLLTGKVPFDGEVGEVLRRVQRGDLRRPRSVAPWVPPALESICLKAMAVSPIDRFDTPRALGEDLERWLADEPVSAHRDPWTAPIARFCRRHRAIVVPGVGLMVALVLAWGLLLHYRARWALAEASRDRAEVSRSLAEASRVQEVEAATAKQRLAEQKQLLADREHERLLEAAHREARIRNGFAAIDRAREARTARRPGWTWSALTDLAGARAAGVGDVATLRDGAAAALSSPDLRPRAVLDPGIAIGWPAHHFAFSPDGRRLAAVSYRPSSRIYYAGAILEVESGAIVRPLRFLARVNRRALLQELEGVRDVAYSAEGRWLAIGTTSGEIHLWDEASPSTDGMPTITWEAHSAPILRVAFAAGALFTTADDRTLKRWEPPGVPKVIPKASHAFRADQSLEKALEVEEGPSIRIVADGALLRLDPSTLAIRERTPVDASRYEFGWALPGPGGLRFAAVKGWEVGLLGMEGTSPLGLQDPRLFRAAGGGELGLRFAPDGSMLLALFSSSGGRGVRLWDLTSGASVTTIPVRGHHSVGAAFSANGRRLAVAEEKKFALYEVRTGEVRSAVAQAGGPIRAFSVAPDDSTMTCVSIAPDLSAASATEATSWDLPGGRRLSRAVFPGMGSAGTPASASVAYHPTGDATVQTGNGPNLFLHVPGADVDWKPLDAGGHHPRAVFSGDGRRVWAITGGSGGFDRVISADLTSGKVVEVWRDEVSLIASGLAGLSTVTAGRGLILVGANDGSCYLFRNGEVPNPPEKWILPRDPVKALCLTRDGELAAIGRQSGALEVRRVVGGETCLLDEAHGDAIGAIAFAPDGRTLASGSVDRTIRLWRQIGATWADPLTLPSEFGPVLALGFSSDGRKLYAVADGEAAVRVWHLDTLRDRLAEIGLAWEGFSPPTAPR